MSPMCSALSGTKNERVALTDMSVNATLHDLLSEVTVRQTYRNLEDVNIEAVYTFPLPLDAQLLNLEVKLGERVLHGVVTKRREAEQRYEDAIAEGNAAVMMEMLEPGLYAMNVGNLLPNETATVTVTYVLLYRWSGDRLRVFIPTVIAERYGRSEFQPHQVTESSMTVENAFSLQVEVRGALRDARFASPSHNVTLASDESRTLISLRSERAVMDRDFVLEVTAPRGVRSFAMSGEDGEGVAAIASFQPVFSGLVQPRALSLGLVIDCSGSMEGMSIQQAKRAIDEILRQLGPSDRVSIVAFGSHVVRFADRLEQCTEGTIVRARAFVQSLDANMGGTEIESALESSVDTLRGAANADVFLVTDGQVSNWERVVGRARRSRHRFFTVGVGVAVAEAFVRELASRTGGACELVSPNELMSDRVVRHFERIRAPRSKHAVIRWPEGARDVFPSELSSVFEGDTIIASARFDRGEVAGEVTLELETDEGVISKHAIPLSGSRAKPATEQMSTIARVAAAMRLETLDETTARATALRYRLTSRFTNWLVVAERAEGEKRLQLPELRKVPQVQVHGIGGMVSFSHATFAASLDAGGVLGDKASPPIARSRAKRASSPPSLASPVSAAPSSAEAPDDEATLYEFEPVPHFSFGEPEFSKLVGLINADPECVFPWTSVELLDRAGYSELARWIVSTAVKLNVDPREAASMALMQLLHVNKRPRELSPQAKEALTQLQSRMSARITEWSAEAHSSSRLGRVVRKIFHGGESAAHSVRIGGGSRAMAVQRFLSIVTDPNLWRGV